MNSDSLEHSISLELQSFGLQIEAWITNKEAKHVTRFATKTKIYKIVKSALI